MPNGLNGNGPNLPDPMGLVDALFDTVMAVPKLPGEVVQRVGNAASANGNEMEGAVRQSTNPDVLPDPVTFVAGAIDYVLSIPKGAFSAIRGGSDGVIQTAGDVQNRWRRATGP